MRALGERILGRHPRAHARDVTVPSMWESLSDPAVSPGLRNFRHRRRARAPAAHAARRSWTATSTSGSRPRSPSSRRTPTPSWPRRSNELAAPDRLRAARRRLPAHADAHRRAHHEERRLALADRFHFETYNLGHLITAGVRHYEVTGQHDAARCRARRAASFLEDLATNKPLELARSAICPSHYMAVIDLYRVTGDERYLRLAEAFVRVRDDFEGGDDNQDRLPVREQTVVAGHAVRANYLYAGLADLVAETGDDELQRVLESLWRDVVDTKLYVTGGCGALYDGASPDGDPWQERDQPRPPGLRPRVPAAAHDRPRRVVREHRHDPVERADAGAHRRRDATPTSSSRSPSTPCWPGISLDGIRVLLHERPPPGARPALSAAPPGRHRAAPGARRRRRPTSACASATSAASAARRTSPARWRGSTSVPRPSAPTACTSTCTAAASCASHCPTDGRRSPCARTATTRGTGRIAFTVTDAAGGGMPAAPAHPGLVLGRRAHGERRAGAGARPRARTPRSSASGGRATWSCSTCRCRCGCCARHRLAEEATNQVAVQRGPVVYCRRERRPAGGRRARAGGAAPRRARCTPVEAEIAGHRVVALDAELAVLPAPRSDALYDDARRRRRWAPHPCDSSPTSRGATAAPAEMSVWLPLVW